MQALIVDTLARDCSEGLYAHLTEKQMQAVVECNYTETTPGTYHSHDFCGDALIVLYEVLLRHEMDPSAEGDWTSTARCGIWPGS